MSRKVQVLRYQIKKPDKLNSVQKGASWEAALAALKISKRLRMIKYFGNEKMGFRLVLMPTKEET